MELPDHISISKNVRGGEAVVKGTRIPVYAVMDLLSAGKSTEEIISRYYPTLTPADIMACMLYASMLVKEESVYAA